MNALKNGLEEMSHHFIEILVPNFNSEEALKLKNHLNRHHPALLDAVSNRFQILSKPSVLSRETVFNLVNKVLESGSLPEYLLAKVKNLKARAQAEHWDQNLSPNTTLLIKKLRKSRIPTEGPKLDCAKKLTF